VKKFLFSLGALFFVLAGAILIAPQFIDWNQYKSEISAAVRDATGRELKIDGDIEVTVIPSPALKVSGVRFANVAGAASKDMLVLDDVRVSVAIGDLIRGKIAVILTLMKPVVALEVTRKGRANWDIGKSTPRAPTHNTQVAPAAKAPPSSKASLPVDVQLDSFRIVEGIVTYRDARDGAMERIQNLNSDVSFDSLNGPFRLNGDAEIRGFPLRFEVGTGKIVDKKPTPVSITLSLKQGGGDLKVNGEVSGITSAPTFNGKVTVLSENLALLIGGLTGAVPPALLKQKLTIEAKLAASQSTLSLTKMGLQLGSIRGTGAATMALSGTPSANARLRFSSLDLDSLIKEQAKSAKDTAKVGAQPNAKQKKDQGAKKTAEQGQGNKAAAFTLPTGIDIALDVGADVVKFNGGVLRQALAKLRLAQGKLFVEQASILLPGNGSAALAGTIEASKGKPFANMRIKAQSDDLRGLLKWLKVEPSGVSASRLRRFSFDTILQGTTDNLQAKSLSAKLDNTGVKGGLTVVLGAKPAFGLRLAVDRINLDAYIPRGASTRGNKRPQGQPAGVGKGGAKPTANPSGQKSGQNPAGEFLQKFNANIVASVKSLTFQKQPVRDVKADLSIVGGVLTIKKISVANFAGAAVTLSGRVNKPGAKPALIVKYNAVVNDTKRLFRLLGISAPVRGRKIGRLASSGKLAGDFQGMDVISTIKVLGGAVTLNGRLNTPLSNPSFDMGADLNFPELSTVIQLGDPGYRPARGKLGPLALSFRASGTPRQVKISGLKGNLGPTSINGSLSANLAFDVPSLNANINLGAVALDHFKSRANVGARSGASSSSGRGARPQKGRWDKNANAGVGGNVHRRWSRNRIAVEALKAANADFSVSMASLNAGGIVLQKPQIQGTLKKGVLKINTLKARVFNGAISGTATVKTSTGVPTFFANLNVEKVALNQAVPALNKLRMKFGPFNLGGRVSGPVSIRNLQLSGRGSSEAALVSSLSGQGHLEGTLRVALSGATQAAVGVAGVAGLAGAIFGKSVKALQPLTQVTQTTNRLIGHFSRAPNKLVGDFTIKNGIVQTNNVQVMGQGAVLLTAGSVSLPPWRVNTNSQVIETGQNQPPLLTVALAGDIEQPNVKAGGAWTRVSSQQQRQQTAPKQQPLGGLLNLPQQQTQPQQKSKQIKPQDILKGIFGR
jgi:uncharacterized protein involved in outer membrane biogenesis